MLVRPDAAEDYVRQTEAPPVDPPPPDPGPRPIVHPPAPTTRYHGTVSLDPHRLNKDVPTLVTEIIQHFTNLTDTDIEITLEISANRSSGFDDATIRTVSENSRTLKFTSHGFESE